MLLGAIRMADAALFVAPLSPEGVHDFHLVYEEVSAKAGINLKSGLVATKADLDEGGALWAGLTAALPGVPAVTGLSSRFVGQPWDWTIFWRMAMWWNSLFADGGHRERTTQTDNAGLTGRSSSEKISRVTARQLRVHRQRFRRRRGGQPCSR